MDEYITRNNAISAVCFGCNQEFSDEPCEPSECSIRQSIMALPTADVAPKSEAIKEYLAKVLEKKDIAWHFSPPSEVVSIDVLEYYARLLTEGD